MHVLLIEDMAGFAQPIKAQLEAMGHAVTWIIGATGTDGSTLTGILASADAKPLEDKFDGETSRLVAVDPRNFQLALVDGGLIGPVKDGWDLVPTLVKSGVVVVAISGGGGGNPKLEEAGAKVLLPKEFVVVALREGHLDLGDALAQPDAINQRLQVFITEMRSKVFHASARKERLDLGFPILNEMGQ